MALRTQIRYLDIDGMSNRTGSSLERSYRTLRCISLISLPRERSPASHWAFTSLPGDGIKCYEAFKYDPVFMDTQFIASGLKLLKSGALQLDRFVSEAIITAL